MTTSLSPRDTFYVTTPIYYVNARPHLGSLYSTLIADVIARYARLYGKTARMVTGTDEHGQKVADTAAAAGKDPQSFVDSFIPAFKQVWHDYQIEYDTFIRTTDTYHVRAVQEWLSSLIAKGDIYKARYEGWYSTASEAFLTEKDITARDDQGRPVCPLSGKPAQWISEESYFFRLSAYQDALLAFYEQHPDFITPAERMHEVVQFVKDGLKDLSISRTTVSWGIPFPGDDAHVTYVWADALNNYITAIGYNDPARAAEFDAYWPADVHVMGKDIVRFHAVFWPAFLLASGLPLPRRLLVHGWIKVGDQKMSKSLGNVIDPQDLLATYGSDVVRYYLMRYMAITQDGAFSIDDLKEKANADLANALGNLLSRCTALLVRAGASTLAPCDTYQQICAPLWRQQQEMLDAFERDMSDYYIHRAYGHVWQFIHQINAFVHEQQPWVVLKTDPERGQGILYAACAALHAAAVVIYPLMPRVMTSLLSHLGQPAPEHTGDHVAHLRMPWHRTYTITHGNPLFTKYDLTPVTPMNTPIHTPEQPKAEHTLTPIVFDDLMKVYLLVGEIVDAQPIEASEKIIKMTVNFGEYGTRTICAGIKQYYTPEQIVGRKTVFAANLPPRKLVGVVSEGMTMMAKNEAGVPTFVVIDPSVPAGTRLA